MQLGAGSQWQTLRPLRFEHRFVLAKNRVLKIREFVVGRFKIVHRHADPDLAGLGRHRAYKQGDRFAQVGNGRAAGLGHLGQHGGVGADHFVAVLDHGAGRGMHRRARLHRLATGGQHAGGRHLHLVSGHAGGVAAAQPAFVHKTEMRQIQKILHHARRAAVHQVGSAVDFAQPLVSLCSKHRQGLITGRQPHPDQAVGFTRLMRAGAVAGRRREARQSRNPAALTGAVELPAVVSALQLPILHAAQGQLGAPVRAAVSPGLKAAVRRLPDHHFFLKQQHRLGRAGQVNGLADRVPQCFLDHEVSTTKQALKEKGAA